MTSSAFSANAGCGNPLSIRSRHMPNWYAAHSQRISESSVWRTRGLRRSKSRCLTGDVVAESDLRNGKLILPFNRDFNLELIGETWDAKELSDEPVELLGTVIEVASIVDRSTVRGVEHNRRRRETFLNVVRMLTREQEPQRHDTARFELALL